MEGHLAEEAELDYEKAVLQARLHEVTSDIDELQVQLQLKQHEAETRRRPDPSNMNEWMCVMTQSSANAVERN